MSTLVPVRDSFLAFSALFLNIFLFTVLVHSGYLFLLITFFLHVSKGTPFTRVPLTSSRIPAMGIKELLFRSKFVSP